MRACTIANLCLYVLGSSVVARASLSQVVTAAAVLDATAVAVPDAASAFNAIDKRAVGGGPGDEEIYTERPAEWDNLPPLPPEMALAYEKNVRTEMIAIARAVGFRDSDDLGGEVWLKSFLKASMTYLTLERMDELINEFMQQYNSLVARGVRDRDMLEARLSELDLSQLEEQMAQMVRFRQENEDLGARGQEFLRNPMTRREGQPRTIYSPFYSLTWLQGRQLIIAKARSGRFSRQQLVDYVRSQDPFLAGFEEETFPIVWKALKDFDFRPNRHGNRSRGFGRRARDYFREDADES